MSNTVQFQARSAFQARFALLLTLILLAAVPVHAADEGWLLRFGGAWVQPDIGLDDDDSGALRIDEDDAIGLQLSLERQFSRRLGVELGVTRASSDFSIESVVLPGFEFRNEAEVDFTAFSAGLNVHLTPDGPIDLYVGPLAVYTDFDDLDFTTSVNNMTQSGTVGGSGELALGVQVGADFRFGDGPWALNVAARYVDTDLELGDGADSGNELSFDPLMFNVGFGYRF